MVCWNVEPSKRKKNSNSVRALMVATVADKIELKGTPKSLDELFDLAIEQNKFDEAVVSFDKWLDEERELKK